jgi:hypothetical protein
VKHLRTLVEKQKAELKKLSSQAPTDLDKEAAELYRGLTSFDLERNQPSAKPFAEKLVQKDPSLAYQAGVDILSQSVPGDEKGWTFGHHYLNNLGIDPNRLEEAKAFLEGKVESKVSYTETPQFVPKEFQDAYKSLSERAREYLDFQLDSDDADEKKAGLEHLQLKQFQIDQRKAQEQTQQQAQQTLSREIETEVVKDTLGTFNQFVEQFRESPTYKNVSMSANPTVDAAYKEAINLMVVNLAEPDTVAGQQAANLFKSLGVAVDSAKISELIGIVNGSIETSVRAGKQNYLPAKANADTQKTQALTRLSALRNSIWTQAIAKITAGQKDAAQELGDGGMPNFGGSQQIDSGEKKMSTLDWINARKRTS